MICWSVWQSRDCQAPGTCASFITQGDSMSFYNVGMWVRSHSRQQMSHSRQQMSHSRQQMSHSRQQMSHSRQQNRTHSRFQNSRYINGEPESFRGQSVGEKELVLSTMGRGQLSIYTCSRHS